MNQPGRQPRRALHGVILLDKPLGWTSNDALQKVKGMLRAEKAGHTGTPVSYTHLTLPTNREG